MNFEEEMYSDMIKAMENQHSSVFCGAGISLASGFENWEELLKEPAKSIGLDISKEENFLNVAQYFVNEHQTKNKLVGIINNKFKTPSSSNETIELLTNLPINNYWTTNYDHLIEDHLARKKRKFNKFYLNTDFSNTDATAHDRVYKFHGDISESQSCVITRDDYREFPLKHEMLINALRGQLAENTFLFIGYSFRDPDFLDLIGSLKVILKDNNKVHYYLDKVAYSQKEIDEQENAVKKNNTADNQILLNKMKYANIKQQLVHDDLKRFGIQTICINSFDEINTILKNLNNKFQAHRIFVAGSSRQYPEGWTETKAKQFLMELGARLIQEKLKVTTGMIEGVGPQIVAGIAAEVEKNNLDFASELRITQLPLENGSDKLMSKETKLALQMAMLKDSGIVLFLFGNQFYNDQKNPSISNGVMEDFEHAKLLGKYVIPIRQTGGSSETIYEKIRGNIDDYPYLKEFIPKLDQDLDKESLIDLIIDIILKIESL